MDKKLLEALNNLSFALEELSMAMQEGKGDKNKSATSTALTSGKLEKKIDAIDKGVKQLQSDNKKILKNQEQLIKLAKEQKSGGGAVGDASDPKQKNKIKDGLGTIMLIAVGVLAIGMAFKIIGKVDFASVIALAIALPLVAIAFEKIAKLKDLKPAQMKTVLLIVLVMSAAIAASSYILNMVQPVGILKLITATLIGGTFAALSFGLPKLLKGFEKVSPMSVGKMILFGPAVLLAMSTAIALSSHVLGMIKPVGIFKLITAVLIAGAFAALGYGLGKIMDAFSKMKIDPAKAAATAILMPIVFIGLAFAIAGASYAFQLIKPVGLFKLITAALIGVAFIPLAYSLPFLAKAMQKITIKEALLIPVILVLLATAIMATSYLFNLTETVPFGKLFNIIFQSTTLAAIATTMFVAMKFANKIGVANAVKGGVVLLILSAVIMASSLILGIGTYKNYPTLGWILGVGASLTAFTLAALVLGTLVFGPQGLVVAAGAGAILVMAGVIVATSYILNSGVYDKYPTLMWNIGALGTITAFTLGAAALAIPGVLAMVGVPFILAIANTITEVSKILSTGNYNIPGFAVWGIATTLLFATFTPILLVLAGVAVANSIAQAFGADPWKKAGEMTVGIAQTIVDVSAVLAKGNFTGGPTVEWAGGISLALGAFAPIYEMLARSQGWFTSGPTPDQFNQAIRTVVGGIVFASEEFSGFAEKPGPTKTWAEGVSIALGAFMPVYEILAKSQGWFTKGPTPEQFKSAIMTVSQGIVDAAIFFGDNIAVFDETKVPSKTWAEGVGGAIGAFLPALDFISKNAGWLSGADTEIIKKAIDATARGIKSSSIILSKGVYDKTVSQEWVQSTSEGIKGFVKLAFFTNKQKGLTRAIGYLVTVTSSMLIVAKLFNKIQRNLKNVDPNIMKNVDQNVRIYVGLAQWLTQSKTKVGAVSTVVNNMNKVAKSYSSLATSVQKLNAQLEDLDVEKLNALRNLNASVILMSLMDPEQFKSMMTQLEEKGGVLVGALQDLEKQGSETAPKKGAPSPQIKTGGGVGAAAPQKTMSDLYDIMESVDGKLGSIATSSDKLSKYVDEIRGDDPLVKKNR